jgi:hypothetical protein
MHTDTIYKIMVLLVSVDVRAHSTQENYISKIRALTHVDM